MKLRVLKVMVRILVWPVLLVAGLYLLLLLINWKDQAASADALRLEVLLRDRPPVAETSNGYVYMLGWGHLREHDPLRKKKDLPAYDAIKVGCTVPDRACKTLLETSAKEIDQVLEAESWTLARYRELLAHDGWQLPRPVDLSNFPNLSNGSDGQRLLMIEAWRRAREGDAPAVQALLAADHRYWRMVLASSDDLLSKMFAVTVLRRNLMWGNLVLGQLRRADQAAAMPAQWRTPLTHAERSLLLPIAGEYQFQMQSYGMMTGEAAKSDEQGSWASWTLATPLLQRQDSLNRWLAAALDQIQAVDVDYPGVPAAVTRLKAAARTQQETWSFSDVYNPVGTVLNKMSAGMWIDYGPRVTDLEGVRRAAVLVAELRSTGVAAEQVPAAIMATTLRNPYDAQPFGWNNRTQSLIFTGLEPGARGQAQFAY
jgi:hypothetical protein